MKKRFIYGCGAVLMALSLVACGGPAAETAGKADAPAVQTEAVAEESAAETSEETEAAEEVSEETFEMATPSIVEENAECGVGDVWAVDGICQVVITGVTPVEQRNEYCEYEPEAVYLIDYYYTNDGFGDIFSDELYIGLDDEVVDAEGEAGYSYPVDQTYYPQELPVGASCIAQTNIGVNHDGPFKLGLTIYDSNFDAHHAVFNIDPSAGTPDVKLPSPKAPVADALVKLGETWTVDGQWDLTINSVTATDERNEFSPTEPAAVYIVDYTYKNLGYEDEYMGGLFLSLEDGIVDSQGVMGYAYPIYTDYNPEAVGVDEECHAQVCVAVEHEGPFKIFFRTYDGNGNSQATIFEAK